MKNICVKLSQRENNKYRKMLSSEETIFPEFEPENTSTLPYTPGATLQDDDWFCITNAKEKELCQMLLAILNNDAYEPVVYEERLDKLFDNPMRRKIFPLRIW